MVVALRKLCLALLFIPSSLFAATHTAATCSQADVTTALNAVSANGDVVVIPNTSCTWTGTITYSTAFSFTLQGGGSVASSDTHGNPLTYTGTTNITDGHTGTNSPALLSIGLDGTTGQTFRMTGITITGTNGAADNYNGTVVVSGNLGTQARVDHNHFVNVSDLALSMYQPMSGVVDHNLFDVSAPNLWNGVRIFYTGDDQGDYPWSQPTNLGSSSYIYIENNTFNNGYVNDCTHGGTFVARYNSLYWGQPSQNTAIQTHATGAGDRGRGCRAWEIYNNWGAPKAAGDTLQFVMEYISSGTGVIYHNSVSNSDNGDVYFISNRDSNDTYTQVATPNGFGYCGTNQNGTGSGWDGNTNTATGYPCLDQPGRGQGDLLSGYWPSVVNTTTGTIAWPHQALEPIYVWKQVLNTVFNPIQVHSANDNIQANRDYYADATSFNGTSGTGEGLLSARPSTCTVGVAYFATNSGPQGTLYQCKTTNNNWVALYQPLAYPHPLVSGSPSLISTTLSLGAASTNPTAGTSDLLTATLSPSSGPTGTVTFYDGVTSLGTGTVSSGVATFNVTSVSGGSHTYSAVYGGDSSYTTSTSGNVSVNGIVPSTAVGLPTRGMILQ